MRLFLRCGLLEDSTKYSGCLMRFLHLGWPDPEHLPTLFEPREWFGLQHPSRYSISGICSRPTSWGLTVHMQIVVFNQRLQMTPPQPSAALLGRAPSSPVFCSAARSRILSLNPDLCLPQTVRLLCSTRASPPRPWSGK